MPILNKVERELPGSFPWNKEEEKKDKGKIKGSSSKLFAGKKQKLKQPASPASKALSQQGQPPQLAKPAGPQPAKPSQRSQQPSNSASSFLLRCTGSRLLFLSPKLSVLSPFFLDSSHWEQKPAEKLHYFSLLFFIFSLVFICRFYFLSLFL